MEQVFPASVGILPDSVLTSMTGMNVPQPSRSTASHLHSGMFDQATNTN